jgi:hypothetical protein
LVKNFEVTKAVEKEQETPKNVNNDPKIFFLIQQFNHTTLKVNFLKIGFFPPKSFKILN